MPKTTLYSTREVNKEDIIDLLVLGKTFTKEAGHSRLGWDSTKMYAFYDNAINSKDFFFHCLVADNEVVGFLIGFLAPAYFSHVLQATEIAWYVVPEHRGKGEALKMLELFEEWSKKHGAVCVNMGSVEIIHAEKIAKVYNKRGYTLNENTFTKELT